jgi:hypothetical protein
LQRWSSSLLIARPLTVKLSIGPACLARPWQRTSGRLFWVEPLHVPDAQVQRMSLAATLAGAVLEVVAE